MTKGITKVENGDVVKLDTFRKNEISLAEENDNLARKCEELEIEKLKLENRILELEQKSFKKKNKISLWRRFWAFILDESDLKKEIRKAKKFKRKIGKERRDLKIFLDWVEDEARKTISRGEKIVFYESTLNFSYEAKSGKCYAETTDFSDKNSWTNDDFIDTMIEEGIDFVEFRETVEENFLEYLRNSRK